MKKLTIVCLLLSLTLNISPTAAQGGATQMASFGDETDLFTLQYPADLHVAGASWVAERGGPPFPNVVLVSTPDLLVRSATPPYDPVKQGEWGIAVFFFPKPMFAQMGVPADASITEIGEAWTKANVDQGTPRVLPPVTLANGKLAFLVTGSSPGQEDNYMMLHETAEGVIVLTALLSAVDGRTDEMIAAHLALTNSIKFTGTVEDILKMMPAPAQ